MSIVSRSCAEAAVLMQTRKDKLEQFSARQGLRMAQQMQRSEPPVEAVQTQMLGEPVLQLVFALERVSAGCRCWLLARLRGGTHCVETLDVAHMLVDEELHLVRHTCDAGAAWPRGKRHVCGDVWWWRERNS